MLNKIYNNGGKYLLLFLLFNFIYFILIGAVTYALPFVLGIFITIWLTPISKYLHRKTKLPKGFLNISCILISIIIFTLSIALILFGIINETKTGLSSISINSLDTSWIYSKITDGKSFLDNISPDIVTSLSAQLEKIISSLGSLFSVVANQLIKIASAIPGILIGLIITILTSFFLMKDYDTIQEKITTIDLGKQDILIKKIIFKIYSLIVNYIQSYGILLTITFIECFIIFSLIKSKYVLTLSVFCVILDILPIIGTAIVLLPMALYYIIIGKYTYAAILLISYTLMIVIRNIMEPKLLSKTMEIHPVLILFSLYVGLKIGGITAIIYLIFLIAFFQILYECDIIKIKTKKKK